MNRAAVTPGRGSPRPTPPLIRTAPNDPPDEHVSPLPRIEAGPPLTRCRGPVSTPQVPGGVVHKLPADLRKALLANTTALNAWNNITPLARNEFICWVENAKQRTTRERRIRRTQEEMQEGQRRPCCWPGCKHRERTGR